MHKNVKIVQKLHRTRFSGWTNCLIMWNITLFQCILSLNLFTVCFTDCQFMLFAKLFNLYADMVKWMKGVPVEMLSMRLVTVCGMFRGGCRGLEWEGQQTRSLHIFSPLIPSSFFHFVFHFLFSFPLPFSFPAFSFLPFSFLSRACKLFLKSS